MNGFFAGLIFLCILAINIAVASPPDKLEIPFILQKGAVLIQVTLRGQGPFNLAIATGTPRSTLAWSVKEIVGYQGLFTIDPLTDKQVLFVQATDLQIGQAKFNSLPMRLVDLDSFRQELGVPLHGILGYDFLKGRVIRIDYRQQRLSFLPKETHTKENSSTSSSQAIKLPFDLNPDDPRPVINDAVVNGVKLKLMLDTWQNLPLALTPQAIKQLGLSPPAEKTPPRIGTVESFQLAGLKLSALQTAFYAKGTGLDHGLNKYGGILGGGFFQNYVVTFDYAKKLLVIE